jgi:hypothetical protein
MHIEVVRDLLLPNYGGGEGRGGVVVYLFSLEKTEVILI